MENLNFARTPQFLRKVIFEARRSFINSDHFSASSARGRPETEEEALSEMELAHTLTLNEEALKQLPEHKRPVFELEWLRYLEKALPLVSKAEIKTSQKKLVQQLSERIQGAPGPPIRKLIASALATLFSEQVCLIWCMGWWQPPSWWETPHRTSTTERPTSPPTLPHRPAIFAPATPPEKSLEGNDLFAEIGDDEDFDDLPLSLIRDIQNERYDFTNDVESLDNFLRLYDDNYGRAAFGSESAMDRWSTASIAGKKRVPPTKPYVDFLLVYDLLKRDAKAASLSKYEGYSEDLLVELHALSQVSAARQLHTLFKRMLDRGDIQRSDVVARVQGIAKDLGNPKSATSKALTFIPSMQFLP
ncbi:uncharacterized protein Dyak_GE25748 [Drosophila yakuba]|uniref:Uncharacterized protein n=1 Tax=Drosophila yakuba TaxID=7245 RepID=B4PQX6_DROYA|nr:uncharacterized protein Dyak_GE25748 [Drosophila yakuba]